MATTRGSNSKESDSRPARGPQTSSSSYSGARGAAEGLDGSDRAGPLC